MADADLFPSLVIRADRLEPLGAFAEAQAAFLDPDPTVTGALGRQLRAHRVGVVAHFYMDPELQGVLGAVDWPHVHVSDSLAMADAAVKMAEAGLEAIVVLGVDFMAENVRAVLDEAGFERLPVYRVTQQPIGCSLAEAAEAPAYGDYLREAAKARHPLHVIYINTSLGVKARAQALVPTITCTSSNVVRTVLQAFAQVPELDLYYGPDTYMGENLRTLFAELACMDTPSVAAAHPEHTPSSIADLLGRFHYFKQGACIVHHLFGQDVAARVRSDYSHAFITAHLEVPGEMFALALEAQHSGRGVVGSTSDILGFIAAQLDATMASPAAAHRRRAARLCFVLGTEAGMVTPIVRRVQARLRECRELGRPEPEVEIVFPVASEAVARTDDRELRLVPGVADGEGCSAAGGCATCRYMKMNSLDGLLDLLARMSNEPAAALLPFAPRRLDATIDGRPAAALAAEPILYMRELGRTGRLPEALVAAIRNR